jgi:hypothetical protein
VNGQRVLVESACITAVTFSSELSVLQLEFRNGISYAYFGVSAELHQRLLSAPSKGAFVSRFIRGRFPYSRLGQAGVLTQ